MIDFYRLSMSTNLSLQLGHFAAFPLCRVSGEEAHMAVLVGAVVSSSFSHPHPMPTFGLEQRGLPTYPVSPFTSASTRAYRVTTAISRCSSLRLPGEACGEVRALGCSCLEVGEDWVAAGGLWGSRRLAVRNGIAPRPS